METVDDNKKRYVFEISEKNPTMFACQSRICKVTDQ